MKKLLYVISVLLVAFAFVACDNGDTPSVDPEDVSGGENVVITDSFKASFGDSFTSFNFEQKTAGADATYDISIPLKASGAGQAVLSVSFTDSEQNQFLDTVTYTFAKNTTFKYHIDAIHIAGEYTVKASISIGGVVQDKSVEGKISVVQSTVEVSKITLKDNVGKQIDFFTIPSPERPCEPRDLCFDLSLDKINEDIASGEKVNLLIGLAEVDKFGKPTRAHGEVVSKEVTVTKANSTISETFTVEPFTNDNIGDYALVVQVITATNASSEVYYFSVIAGYLTLYKQGAVNATAEIIEIITDFGEKGQISSTSIGGTSYKSFWCEPASTTTICLGGTGQSAVYGKPCILNDEWMNFISFKKESVKDFNCFEIDIEIDDECSPNITLQDMNLNAKHHEIILLNESLQWGYSARQDFKTGITAGRHKLAYFFHPDGNNVSLYLDGEFQNTFGRTGCRKELTDKDNLKLTFSKTTVLTLYSVAFYK